MYAANTMKVEENEELKMIKMLDKDQLYELINDDEKIDAIINNSQQVTSLANEKESIIMSNKSLAEYNLSFEPTLSEAKSKLSSAYSIGIEVQKNYENRKLELDALSATMSLDTVLAILQAEAAKTEDESEALSDQFIEGNIKLDEFLDEFSSSRKLYHMRKIKSEKMAELLREKNAQRNRPAPPVSNDVPNSNSAFPYSQYYNVANNWSNFTNNQYSAYNS